MLGRPSPRTSLTITPSESNGKAQRRAGTWNLTCGRLACAMRLEACFPEGHRRTHARDSHMGGRIRMLLSAILFASFLFLDIAYGIRTQAVFSLHDNRCQEPPPLDSGLTRDDVCPVHKHIPRKANAVLLMLTRNSDLKDVVSSMKMLEDTFNKKFGYPYVFLNDEPFNDEFRTVISQLTDAPVQFGLVPPEDWNQPPWIDEGKASAARDEMESKNVMYGGSLSYRNMCRFYSGFFYRHELLKPYRYYWRFEPNVNFFCDVDHDPFLFMQDNNKVYGFTISFYEFINTIPTLWSAVKEFMDANPELISSDNAMNFISDDNGTTYNQCHFWSNFEIGDLELWRGEAYSKFFDFLDKKGGFHYERWGDAPVHSIGAALFARKDQIHFFNDIGYKHFPIQHCPQGDVHRKGRCQCDSNDNADYKAWSCLSRYERLFM